MWQVILSYIPDLLLCTKQHKKDDTLKKKIKEYVGREIVTSCPLLDYAKVNNLQILTTNYDFNIEQALGFCAKSPHTHRTIKNKVKDTYALYDCFGQKIPAKKPLVFEKQEGINNAYILSDHCTVWHIHGHCKRYKTILLGIEDYIDSIIYVKDQILKNGTIEFKEPWDDGFKGMNTWLRPFFTQPLIITGLTIGSGEIFLRWLLLRRARAQIDGKIILPPVYYLDPEKETRNTKYRNEYFKMLNIQVVSFKDYDDLYENSGWNRG